MLTVTSRRHVWLSHLAERTYRSDVHVRFNPHFLAIISGQNELVQRTGFEPVFSTLRGWRDNQLTLTEHEPWDGSQGACYPVRYRYLVPTIRFRFSDVDWTKMS